MMTLRANIEVPFVENVVVSNDTLWVDLRDGQSISVPLPWVPRLLHASKAERKRWRVIGRGVAIYWENMDEDIGVESLLQVSHPLRARRHSARYWRSDRLSRCRGQSVRAQGTAGGGKQRHAG